MSSGEVVINQWIDLEYIYIHSWCSRRHKHSSSPTVEGNPGGHRSARHRCGSLEVLKVPIQVLSQGAQGRGFSGCICQKGQQAWAPLACTSPFLKKSWASGVLGMGEASGHRWAQGGVPPGAGAWCEVFPSYPTHWLLDTVQTIDFFQPIFLSIKWA